MLRASYIYIYLAGREKRRENLGNLYKYFLTRFMYHGRAIIYISGREGGARANLGKAGNEN